MHTALGPNVQLPSPRISDLTPATATAEVDETVELIVVTGVLVELGAIDGEELVEVVVDGELVVVAAGTVLVGVELNTVEVVEVTAVVVLAPEGATVDVGEKAFADTMSRRALLTIGP